MLYRFQPNYAIVKKALIEAQSLLGGVLVEPPEDGGERGGTKGKGGCFRLKRNGRGRGGTEVEAPGKAAVAVADVADGAPVIPP